MALRWYSTVVNAADHHGLARWWAESLEWDVVVDTDAEAIVLPPWASQFTEILDFHHVPPGLVFVPGGGPKTSTNRLHLDLAPSADDDRDGEIADLVERGARVVDVGQPADASWTVLADPEGNEFCVLSSRSR